MDAQAAAPLVEQIERISRRYEELSGAYQAGKSANDIPLG